MASPNPNDEERPSLELYKRLIEEALKKIDALDKVVKIEFKTTDEEYGNEIAAYEVVSGGQTVKEINEYDYISISLLEGIVSLDVWDTKHKPIAPIGIMPCFGTLVNYDEPNPYHEIYCTLYAFPRELFDAAISIFNDILKKIGKDKDVVIHTSADYLLMPRHELSEYELPTWMDADIVIKGDLIPLRLSKTGDKFFRKKNWRTYTVKNTLSGVGVKPGLGVIVKDFVMYKSYDSAEFETFKQKPIDPIENPDAVIEDGLWKFQWNTGICADVFKRTMKADFEGGIVEVTVPLSKLNNVNENAIRMAFDASAYIVTALPKQIIFYLPQLRILLAVKGSDKISEEECRWKLGWEERRAPRRAEEEERGGYQPQRQHYLRRGRQPYYPQRSPPPSLPPYPRREVPPPEYRPPRRPYRPYYERAEEEEQYRRNYHRHYPEYSREERIPPRRREYQPRRRYYEEPEYREYGYREERRRPSRRSSPPPPQPPRYERDYERRRPRYEERSRNFRRRRDYWDEEGEDVW